MDVYHISHYVYRYVIIVQYCRLLKLADTVPLGHLATFKKRLLVGEGGVGGKLIFSLKLHKKLIK